MVLSLFPAVCVRAGLEEHWAVVGSGGAVRSAKTHS